MGWLGAGPRLRSPPLVINGEQISEPLAKAETLQREVFGRFSAEDNLQGDPLEAWSADEVKIPWDTQVNAEKAERSCIGVTSTSPGIDGITVRLLKAGWVSLAEPVRRLYQPVRAILPAYKTTPSSIVFRDARLPSARVALAYTRLKYGARLRFADKGHPLVNRLRKTPRARNSGHSATTLQTVAQLLPRIRKLELRAPRNAPDSRTNPTGEVLKKEAARRFIEWLDIVLPNDIVVYTDGSEKHENNCVQIGYGWAAFRAGLEFAAGSAFITPESHVFDAEAIGALKGLQAAAKAQPGARIWICVDSTSVIWGFRGDAPRSSQWAFLEFHNLVDLLRK
ncbi:reverse transcriptase [Pyricularia oryzae]|nr:reverse transcriptase [Pyricularia oryzae]